MFALFTAASVKESTGEVAAAAGAKVNWSGGVFESAFVDITGTFFIRRGLLKVVLREVCIGIGGEESRPTKVVD